MPNNQLKLTVVITVVSGKESLRRCLAAVTPQIDFAETEVVVPYDEWSKEVGELAPEFPSVNFHFVKNLNLTLSGDISTREHRLYDRRRAAGLQVSRGRIVAMTEDHVLPARDWCHQILAAHECPAAVIGGAIENGIDRPLNWAWYYCDFGRYGRPMTNREPEYVSDVNVSYKRAELMEIYEVWCHSYHETTVHWALRDRGVKLLLNEKIAVFQHRPTVSLKKAWFERFAWGRIFAETRSCRLNVSKRFGLAAGTIFLPILLLLRIIRHMLRQKRTARQLTSVLPFAIFLLAGWAVGEFWGYLSHPPQSLTEENDPILNSTELNSENLVNQ